VSLKPAQKQVLEQLASLLSVAFVEMKLLLTFHRFAAGCGTAVLTRFPLM